MADEDQISDTPPRRATRLDRVDWLGFTLTMSITLAVYLWTLAPEVTLAWSGVMSTTAMYGGVGPPSSYPVWTIYSWLFVKLLPFSNVAWRAAVGSAVAGAGACGLVSLMVSSSAPALLRGFSPFEEFDVPKQNQLRLVCGCVAGLALGFSVRFWYEAVISEYWIFDALLFAATLCLLTRWMVTRRRYFCWLAFLMCGLLLTNNEALIIILPGLLCAILMCDARLGRDVSLIVLPLGAALTLPGGIPIWNGIWDVPMSAGFAASFLIAVIIAVVTRRIGSEWKSTLACAGFLLFSISAFFYLPIASMTNPPMNWGYSRTLDGFIHDISRGQYEKANPAGSFARFAALQSGLLQDTGKDFGWIYLVFTLLPVGFLWHLAPSGRKWVFALAPMFVCAGPLLTGVLNIGDYGSKGIEVIFEPYFFSMDTLLAFASGIGLMLFACKVVRRNPPQMNECIAVDA